MADIDKCGKPTRSVKSPQARSAEDIGLKLARLLPKLRTSALAATYLVKLIGETRLRMASERKPPGVYAAGCGVRSGGCQEPIGRSELDAVVKERRKTPHAL